MKITYFAATSRDGFIARENGDVSWLDEMNIDLGETGLEEFFASVDGLVMGRKTYEFIFEYGSWPYEEKLTWVCTSSDIQSMEGANLIVVGDIDAVVSGAVTRGFEHLWLVGGGQLASSFLEKGLITNVSISVMPITLDNGIHLFSDHKLEDIVCEDRSVEEKNGFKQMEIVVKNNRDVTKG